MDGPLYPLPNWLDRLLSAHPWTAPGLLLALIMMQVPTPVRAQSWETNTKVLPSPIAPPPIAADITGDHADELLVLTEDRQLALLVGLNETVLRLQPLAPAPPAPADAMPYRFAAGSAQKDRIAWISDHAFIEWRITPSMPPTTRSFTLPPPARFLPRATGWRCLEKDKAWIGASLPGQDGCVGIYCLEPLANGELPARSGSQLCENRVGPFIADVDGSGLHLQLQSDPALRNWLLFQGTSARPWASFPSRVMWRGAVVGDFDRDGRDDILVFGEPLRSASIAYSKGSYSIERPVPWPFSEQVRTESITVGDFDGDGSSDLAAVSGSPAELHIAYARPPAPPSRRGKGAVIDFNAPQLEPAVCLGYNPFAELGASSKWGIQSSMCPPGTAYFGASEGLVPEPARASVIASCCRLPRPDILLDEHLTAPEECPAGYVITGSEGRITSLPAKIRCTRVNTARYSLGPLRQGQYWGNGLSSRGQSEQLQLTDIPVAIRSGIGRSDDSSWQIDGCVGNPIGALLVKKGGKHCQESGYRELLENGKPVKMFPDCQEIENIFDPTSGCR